MFSWGAARVLCRYLRKLGGAHELTQQSSTLKYFRHFNFYYNINHISTALRIEENLLPDFTLVVMSPLIFPLSAGMAPSKPASGCVQGLTPCPQAVLIVAVAGSWQEIFEPSVPSERPAFVETAEPYT